MTTGPEEGAAAGYGSQRASHADREQVIDMLKTAFADGRLDKDELDARTGQTLAAQTYADLAAVTADLPAGPAQARPARRCPSPAARPPVNKEAVKWALLGTGALIPPAMFVTAAFGALTPLALLAMPLLFIELIVAIIFVAATLTSQHKDRSHASRGQLPPRPGPDGDALGAERGGGTGDGPVPPGPGAGQTRAELRADKSRRRVPAPGPGTPWREASARRGLTPTTAAPGPAPARCPG